MEFDNGNTSKINVPEGHKIVSVDQAVLTKEQAAYGCIGDMAVTYVNWKKWHYIRSFGATWCGRTIYGRDVLIIRKDVLDPDSEVCLVYSTQEYTYMH